VAIEVRAKERLRAFLEQDRGLSVYFIGDLAEPYWSRCRWWMDSENPAALALLYAHPQYPTVLTLGDAEGVQRIVEDCADQWPTSFHAHLLPAHVPVFEERYELSSCSTFLRMVQDKEEAGRVLNANADGSVKRLAASDLPQIRDLLNDYPEAFFSDDNLDSGFYFGIYDGPILATMAGVHVVSSESKVAAGGNVVTRKTHRRQGYSKRCTTEALRHLFDAVDVVALNVLDGNVPAIREYEDLGFRRYAELVLGYCRRLGS
jgi:ribosomal protein S18 acetylase RimI-like enzyme